MTEVPTQTSSVCLTVGEACANLGVTGEREGGHVDQTSSHSLRKQNKTKEPRHSDRDKNPHFSILHPGCISRYSEDPDLHWDVVLV